MGQARSDRRRHRDRSDHRHGGPGRRGRPRGQRAPDRPRRGGGSGACPHDPTEGAPARRAGVGTDGAGDRGVRSAAARTGRGTRSGDLPGRARRRAGHGHVSTHSRPRLRPDHREWNARPGQRRPRRDRRLPRRTVSESASPVGSPVPAILELRDIRAGYGPIEVVHGVSLQVAAGSVMALLGPNGGGKTTLLNVCSGTLAPNSGDVFFEGADVTRMSADDRARNGICTVPEGRGIFPNLTVRENLLMATQVGVPMVRIEDVAFSQFPQLSGRRKQMAGTLSGGEQQMLALARAFATDPKLLLLDELSMGLAPIVVGQLYDKVRQLAEAGLSILLVEQFARTALPIADSAAVVLQGVVAHRGSPAEMEEA